MEEGGGHHLAIESDDVLVRLPFEIGAVPRVRCEEDEAWRATAPTPHGGEVITHVLLHRPVAVVLPNTVPKDDHIRLRTRSGKILARWQRLAPLGCLIQHPLFSQAAESQER